MSNLTILNASIRTFDNLYSLSDIHKVSGLQKKHQPSNFIRLDTTQDLITEIDNEILDSSHLRSAIKVINGGKDKGTWVCSELVLAYAMWISAKFHLIVLRAFMALNNIPTSNERRTTVEQRTGLRDAINMLVSKKGLLYPDAYHFVHQRFNVHSIEDLSPEQLPMAVEYVHKICLEGELIIQEPNKPNPDEITIPYNLFQSLYYHGRRGQRLGHQVQMLLQVLNLDSPSARLVASGLAHDCAVESATWLEKAEDILYKRQTAIQSF